MVNLSAHELQQEGLVVHVEKALAASGLEPDALHLEIPEGYAMQDLDRTVETLRALRSVGVHLSIDGFGAGFSSLAHLRRLPVDALKIDLSFVRGATTDADDASIVTAVIAVAHSLGLRVVAQGVETEAQVALLRSLGCDEVQGYLWSPPVPPDECERMLADGVAARRELPARTRRDRPGRRRAPPRPKRRLTLRLRPARPGGARRATPSRPRRAPSSRSAPCALSVSIAKRQAAKASARCGERRRPPPRSPRRSRAGPGGGRGARR